MMTPALGEDPYAVRSPDTVIDLVGWEAAAWHSPDRWATHWRSSGLVDDITARMQEGSRDDWLRWCRAHGSRDTAVAAMLESNADPGWIGSAMVAATKLDSAG
jgi:hypothetical protein